VGIHRRALLLRRQLLELLECHAETEGSPSDGSVLPIGHAPDPVDLPVIAVTHDTDAFDLDLYRCHGFPRVSSGTQTSSAPAHPSGISPGTTARLMT